MSLPRRIRPGATYLVTRRTVRRHHLFRPDQKIRELFLYVLAWCARAFGVQVHAVVLMSTHEHIVLTDVDGRLPDFLRDLHRLVALGTKLLRGWEGAVWDHDPTSVVLLLTPAAIIEKLGYCIANPVAAGLVRKASDWDGVTTRPQDLGRARWTTDRPSVYFARNGGWPKQATLELTLPASLTELYTPEQIRELVAEELKRAEAAARALVRYSRRKILGKRQCARLSPYRRAKSWEPTRDRNPTLAAGRGNVDILYAAIEQLQRFRSAYQLAIVMWCAGDRAVRFPAGTWWMAQFHQASSKPFDP